MIARNVTREEMGKALALVNVKYYQNVRWNRFDENGKGFRFTLKVIDSSGAGAKHGFTRRKDGEHRRTTAACWHVHGHFFEALFAIQSKAVIYSIGKRIDTDGGNWQDRNIGSIMEPFMYSEACACGAVV